MLCWLCFTRTDVLPAGDVLTYWWLWLVVPLALTLKAVKKCTAFFGHRCAASKFYIFSVAIGVSLEVSLFWKHLFFFFLAADSSTLPLWGMNGRPMHSLSRPVKCSEVTLLWGGAVQTKLIWFWGYKTGYTLLWGKRCISASVCLHFALHWVRFAARKQTLTYCSSEWGVSYSKQQACSGTQRLLVLVCEIWLDLWFAY